MFKNYGIWVKKANQLKKSLLDVFGDGLGSFWNSVSGEFPREDKLNSGLDFSGWESSSFVESNELWTFGGNSVEDIVNEGVHDVHGFLWDSDIWVHLLEDLVDIDGEGLNSSSSGFSVSCFSSGCFGHNSNYYEPASNKHT